jgi:hypothetical protein
MQSLAGTLEIGWERVREREVVVDLTNGGWAYGFQIAPCAK